MSDTYNYESLKISDSEVNGVRISKLPDRPNAVSAYGGKKLNADELKKKYDAPTEMMAKKFNNLIDELEKREGPISAEQQRKEAEEKRAENEEKRAEAEEKREERFKEIEALYDNGVIGRVGVTADGKPAILSAVFNDGKHGSANEAQGRSSTVYGFNNKILQNHEYGGEDYEPDKFIPDVCRWYIADENGNLVECQTNGFHAFLAGANNILTAYGGVGLGEALRIAGKNALALGYRMLAYSAEQAVVGSFNAPDLPLDENGKECTDVTKRGRYAFIAGAGSPELRKNAFAITWDGGLEVGYGTRAGSRAFRILGINPTNKMFTLDSVEGLEVGDVYTADMSYNNGTSKLFADCGKITKINAQTKTVTVDVFPTGVNSLVVPEKYVEDGFELEENVFRIIKKPHVGTLPIGCKTIAGGNDTQALSKNGVALGDGCVVYGGNGVAIGYLCRAGYADVALGRENEATGDMSVALGYKNKAKGFGSKAIGGHNVASGMYSSAEGWNTEASGEGAHSEGVPSKDAQGNIVYPLKAAGMGAHAEGVGTQALGTGDHAEGSKTVAKGGPSHAEGGSTQAIGWASHAEGCATKASGGNSHAEGDNSIASGAASHAEGQFTEATAKNTHAEGFRTIASHPEQHVQGRWNKPDTAGQYAHIVGGGASADDRKNIHTLDWHGNAYFAGFIDAAGVRVNGKLLGEASGGNPEEIENIKKQIGDFDIALDAILNIQNSLIGGEGA